MMLDSNARDIHKCLQSSMLCHLYYPCLPSFFDETLIEEDLERNFIVSLTKSTYRNIPSIIVSKDTYVDDIFWGVTISGFGNDH